tara:strand:- start:294 stop:752 length:459 start_codon:yes stop_codon:yes gene_type:complete
MEDEIVYCPPAGKSYERINSLNIYCCQNNAPIREGDKYLLPRIPVNNKKKILKDDLRFNPDAIVAIKGHGFAYKLYEITDIIHNVTLENINELDQQLQDRIIAWGLNEGETLKVLTLSNDPIIYNPPRITQNRNNTWRGHFTLDHIENNLPL